MANLYLTTDQIADQELHGFISSNGTITSEGNYQINFSEQQGRFEQIFQLLSPSNEGKPLSSFFIDDFQIFSESSIPLIEKIADYINPEFKKCGYKYTLDEDIIEVVDYWDELKKKIKHETRFLIDSYRFDEYNWDSLIMYHTTTLDKDTTLFRARVHEISQAHPLEEKDLGAPPATIATAGRANPKGISVLYLADNKTTITHEIRSSYLDEITIGSFQSVKDSLKIIDFSRTISLFGLDKPIDLIKSKLLARKINLDLSKPMRRYDSDLEYIPTQFICEYLKIRNNVDGIKFQSSLHSQGNNYVIFDPLNMKIIKREIAKISKVNIEHTLS